jgi:hypothetical protein
MDVWKGGHFIVYDVIPHRRSGCVVDPYAGAAVEDRAIEDHR